MSFLKEKETTILIEKDATNNKRIQLEMKKNAAYSSSFAMLMVMKDLMCVEVVVEEQQIHIHQIHNNKTRSICSVVKRFDVWGSLAMAY
jgi:hypothetical protein